MSDVTTDAQGAVTEDRPSPNRNPFSIEAPDTYRGGDEVKIIVRGQAEAYDQYFVVALHVEFRDDRAFLEDLSAVAGPERSLIDRVDAEASFSSVTGDITEAVNRLSGSKRKDAQNFRNKLERVLREPEKLENLTEPLRQDGISEFHNSLHEFLLSEMFPGSELQSGARVLSVRKADHETPDNEEQEVGNADQDQKIVEESKKEPGDDSPKMLELRPEYDPMDGVSLRQLRPGDRFDVRVVGNSLYDLKDEYLDGADPEEADQSKIMNAELEDVRDAPLKSVKTYVLRLSGDARGKFSVDPSARVSFRGYSDLSAPVKFRHRLRFFLFATMIFLFSVCLIFFVFPEPFLGLLEELQLSA